ncbi:hypothetical protein GCM10009616_36200 [Microlunatus lacustris]
MKRSWLVQRLQKPIEGRHGELVNAFAFGGGYKNGGLSDEAMTYLRPILRFDYMGSAEFEFGAVPEAFQRVARYASGGSLKASTLSIPLHLAKPGWRVPKGAPKPTGEAVIYVLCNDDDTEGIHERIDEWATGREQLKETTRLSAVLLPAEREEWQPDTCGWFELDNGFLFFTDRDMWQQVCTLFGVTAEELAA